MSPNILDRSHPVLILQVISAGLSQWASDQTTGYHGVRD